MKTHRISDQKQAEDELRQSQKRLMQINQEFQGLFDHSPAGLAIFDAEPPYGVLAHNLVYQQLLG